MCSMVLTPDHEARTRTEAESQGQHEKGVVSNASGEEVIVHLLTTSSSEAKEARTLTNGTKGPL